MVAYCLSTTDALMKLGIDLWVLGYDEVYELYHIFNSYSESSLEAAFWIVPDRSPLHIQLVASI